MATPGNPDPNDPRLTDPLNPTRPLGTGDPVIDNRTVVQPRSNGSTWLIALIVIVLAIVAYYIFARSGPPAPAEPPVATEPAEPAPAPATPPADSTTPPADNSMAPAPAEPAPAPATPPADSGTTAPANPQ